MSNDNPSTDSFEANYALLEKLSSDLDQDSIPVDQLVVRAREGHAAAKVCKAVLKQTAEGLREFEELFAELGDPTKEE